MIKIVALVLAALFAIGATTSACAKGSDPKPTVTADKPTREPGPVPPDDRPKRPAEGVEGIEGCPVNSGIVVDIYHGVITKSQGENRAGLEATFVLRWVNDHDHPSGNGGCWQQTAWTDPDADRRLAECNIEGIKDDGLNWPSCMKD